MNPADHMDITPDNIVAFLADKFDDHGANCYLGERVTTSEHMLQGPLLAEEANAPDILIAGVLLHDIGYYTRESRTLHSSNESMTAMTKWAPLYLHRFSQQ